MTVPRRCRLCSKKIDPLAQAVRVSNVTILDAPKGRLRFWLCCGCADEIERAVQVMARVS